MLASKIISCFNYLCLLFSYERSFQRLDDVASSSLLAGSSHNVAYRYIPHAVYAQVTAYVQGKYRTSIGNSFFTIPFPKFYNVIFRYNLL